MKYYIDFDNTLFDTPSLTECLLSLIASDICAVHSELLFDDVYNECTKMFNREHFYNIYELASFFSDKYSLDLNALTEKINSILVDTSDFLYEDAVPFLKRLKADGHTLYLFTNAEHNFKYQSAKISGAGISDFFDALYITSVSKHSLDLNFSDAIFIDDNPVDLIGLYSNNPIKVIRIRRRDNKYSIEDIPNSDIVEFASLADFEY